MGNITFKTSRIVPEVLTLFQSPNLITTHYGALTLMEEHYLPVRRQRRRERHNCGYLEDWSPFIFPIKPCMTQRCDCVCDASMSVSVSFRHSLQTHLVFGSNQRANQIRKNSCITFAAFPVLLTIFILKKSLCRFASNHGSSNSSINDEMIERTVVAKWVS